VRAGARELVISGINVGSYQSEGADLSALLRCLLEQGSKALSSKTRASQENFRLRLSSVEPLDVNDALIESISAAQGRICRHLHLPLQSGSDAILAAMGRAYSSQQYADLVARLRSAIPRISLSSDVMVGFPGESDDDFRQTLALCESSAFSRIHVFRFSARRGTAAASLGRQLSADTKADRAAELRALAARLNKADAISRLGTTEALLMESPFVGLSESYHRVELERAALKGSLVQVRLGGYTHGRLLGEEIYG
jgi:threonylcarbamoyladenosine tRNA methylthiotransferase MtaB